MNEFQKKTWMAPALEELSVTRTLGGPTFNFTEGDGGAPASVSLNSCQIGCADARS